MEFKRIAVLVSGSGSNLQAILDKEIEYINGKVVLVFSNIKSALALERAKKHGVEAISLSRKKFDSDQAFDEKLVEILKEYKIDLIVLAGYLRIITPVLIDQYENKIINIHPSLLPSFGGKGCYGIHVHEKVLERGCKVSGATVHFVDHGADTGPIILQEAIEVKQDWQAEDLQKSVLKIEHKLLPYAVKLFCEDRLEVRNKRVIIKEQ